MVPDNSELNTQNSELLCTFRLSRSQLTDGAPRRVIPNRRPSHREIGSSALMGATVHPFMDVATEEAPMLPDLRRRQFTDPSELIHGRLGHPKKMGHVHDRQNLAVR